MLEERWESESIGDQWSLCCLQELNMTNVVLVEVDGQVELERSHLPEELFFQKLILDSFILG